MRAWFGLRRHTHGSSLATIAFGFWFLWGVSGCLIPQTVPVDPDGDDTADDDSEDDDTEDDDSDPENLVFSEDWENGIDPSKWTAWGGPEPEVVEDLGFDGSDALDPNGNVIYQSGATTLETFAFSDLPRLEWWSIVHANGESSQLNHQNLRVGFSSTTAADYQGAEEQPDALISVAIEASTSDPKIQYQCGHDSWSTAFVEEEHAGAWLHWEIRVGEDGGATFLRDQVVVWVSTYDIDIEEHSQQAVVIDGQSEDTVILVDELAVYTP